MSKILKSLGLGVLLAALLVGTGMADVGPITVEGCVIHATTFSLGAGTVDSMDLGVLPTTETVGEDGGSLAIIAGAAWTVTVDDAGSGFMLKDSTPLSDEFIVNAVELDGTAQILFTGSANEDCDPQEEAIAYHQTVQSGDAAGDYSIVLTYAGGLD